MRGRLRATFAWWSSWCPCSLVLSVIAKGYWLPWSHGPPQPFHNRNHVGVNTHATFTLTAIQELIETGAAVSMPATELMCTSPLNVVEQKDKCRLILDLRKVNANLIVPKFKYEGLSHVADLAHVGVWMFSIDLKSGYHHIDIHPSCWKFIGFEFEKRTYAFCSLPFGLATAPFICTQLIEQLAWCWREQGIRVIPYVDDILFLCQSKAHAQAICQRVILDLKEAGLVINAKKSQLSPSQRLRFLGVELETDTGRFSIGPDPEPPERKQCVPTSPGPPRGQNHTHARINGCRTRRDRSCIQPRHVTSDQRCTVMEKQRGHSPIRSNGATLLA
ncbi:unnamed protein product [Closterium sp. NIES-53]